MKYDNIRDFLTREKNRIVHLKEYDAHGFGKQNLLKGQFIKNKVNFD